MSNTLAALFDEIASRANSFDEPVLAHLCRMAAIESRKTVIPWAAQSQINTGPVGLFDWDIANDINRLDPAGAEFFGVAPQKAAKGLPNGSYLHAIHPDDVETVGTFLHDCMKGGVSEARYRVVTNNRARMIFSKGFCTLDPSNRPDRFAGMMMVVDPQSP